MPIIDVHHHWINEADYIERLLREMDRLDIERTGLMALGAPFRRLFLTHSEPEGCADNRDVVKAVARWPDRFFGYGFIRLGYDAREQIDWFVDNGFVGLKFHIPAWRYDDERCFPIYERASRFKMICLFHTGILRLPEPLPDEHVSSARCQPIMLDAVTNTFPQLVMILAHLGTCWAEEAAMLCRLQPNVYADLSGAAGGWRTGKPIEWFREILYWPDAHRKILFGSDVHCAELADALQEQEGILKKVGWSKTQRRSFLYDNAAALLANRPCTAAPAQKPQ